MTLAADLPYDHPDLANLLAHSDAEQLDVLRFGVIGFDRDGRVQRYNQFESQAAGLRPERVLGLDVFVAVAPCMNNDLVAQRFADARQDGAPLDETLNYVLTLRMRPTKVKLRLLSQPESELAFVLVERA
ncbi:phosphonate transporter [Duganella sp. Leaf126]|uniref:PAS domain-containing protein n=1 Tax=Duganella sp. Leaf126 TaxID=1736266 RepID=UPI0006F3A802|nr:PAS domain-containing protein [Duganella sp. Leaf126]KQQ32346.1 phosphonate transporter [Duganella sp. Leaf126]